MREVAQLMASTKIVQAMLELSILPHTASFKDWFSKIRTKSEKPISTSCKNHFVEIKINSSSAVLRILQSQMEKQSKSFSVVAAARAAEEGRGG